LTYEERLASGATCGSQLAKHILIDLQHDAEAIYWGAEAVYARAVTLN
jgi:hypothetical protein